MRRAWLLVLALAFPVAAQPPLPADLDALVRAAPRADDLPDASAVYLRDEKTLEVDADGRATATVRQTVLILREAGRRHGVVNLPWTTAGQAVKVDVARIVRADGRLVDLGEDALQSEPAGVYGATFGDVTRWRLTFPFADPGAVIDYQVTTSDNRPTVGGRFADRFLMQAVDPIVSCVYTVRTPAGTVFRSHVHGTLSPPEVRRRGQWDETVWRARDVAPIENEPGRPPFLDLALWVLVTSEGDWAAVAGRYREVAAPQYVAHRALREAVARETQGQADPVEALYRYTTSRIRYGTGALEAGAPGIQPQPAYSTFDLGVGDCKDQVTLLITLLREAGVTAYPALLRRTSTGPVALDAPAMLQFDHVIVAVPQGGGRYRWFDPTWSYGPAGYLPPDVQGAQALLVTPNGSEWLALPRAKAADNRRLRQADLALSADGAVAGSATVTATGAYEQSLRWLFHGRSPAGVARVVADGLEDVLPNLVFDAAGVRLSPVADLAQPFRLEYGFRSDSYVLRTRRLLLLRPALFEQAQQPEGLAAGRRDYPLQLAAAPETTDNQLRLRLPPDLAVLEIPPSRSRREAFGSFAVGYTLRDNVLEYRRSVTLHQVRIEPEQVATVRDWYRELGNADREFVVLQRREEN